MDTKKLKIPIQHNRPLLFSATCCRGRPGSTGLSVLLHVNAAYMTKQGFIGLGPLSVEPLDQVWILQAAKVPFILRPMDRHGKFNLIGETYVHGFMDGEFAAAGLFQGWIDINLV